MSTLLRISLGSPFIMAMKFWENSLILCKRVVLMSTSLPVERKPIASRHEKFILKTLTLKNTKLRRTFPRKYWSYEILFPDLIPGNFSYLFSCLLYTSDAADE